MKVLLCSPLTGIVGGIARWTNHIKKYYENNRTSQSLELEFFDFSRKTSGQCITSKYKKIYYAFSEYYKLIRDAIKAINDFDGQVIHITTPASFLLIKDLILLHFAKKKGLKTIIHFRFGRIPELFIKRNLEYRLLVRVVKKSDCVIVIDENSYNTLTKAGFSNIELLPNPLTPAVGDIIKANKIERIPNKLVFAGHVIPAKGVYELVKACKEIPNANLYIVGAISDDIKKSLVDIAGDTLRSRLHIIGELNYDETIKQMMSSNVFILPTYTEGFPNVILESMACGCSIVTTDVGAIPEMLDIKNGYNYGICVKPKDIEGLKKAILKMLTDKEYASSCGKNAKNRVEEQYSMPIVWAKLKNIWNIE